MSTEPKGKKQKNTPSNPPPLATSGKQAAPKRASKDSAKKAQTTKTVASEPEQMLTRSRNKPKKK